MSSTPFLKLAVIGDPVAHSKSPGLHRTFLRETGREGSYEAIRVPLSSIEEELARLAQAGYLGLNVTTPLKEAALACAEMSDTNASLIGAANTLTYDRASGGWIAANTDGEGARAALELALGQAVHDRQVLVLGVGPTGRAAVAALLAAGANVTIWNRSVDRAYEIVRRFGASLWDEQCVLFDAVMSTLPPDADLPLSIATTLMQCPVVVDANYSVRATLARELKRQVTTGESMLAAQARASFRIWSAAFPDEA